MKLARLVVLALALGAAALRAQQPRGVQGIEPAAQTAAVAAVGPVALTVTDMERSVAFYTAVLDFREIADTVVEEDGYGRLEGVPGSRMRVVRLVLGEETLQLMAWRRPTGRSAPAGARSNDRWFQHVAIIVSDMDSAYAVLQAHGVERVSPAPQRLPDWNPNAGGIRAFYFHDPDQHPLEILQFPPDKGDPKWRRASAGGRLFLGIDHTAIVVSNTETSLRFYRDLLGLRVAGKSLNYGPEQERLNNVPGARLRITSLRAAAGPGIEFLEYVTPRDGRPAPADERANDVVHWQTVVATGDPERLASRLTAAGVRFVSPGVVRVGDRALGFDRGFLVRTPTATLSRSSPLTDVIDSLAEISDMPPTLASNRASEPAVDERGPRKMMKAIAVFPGRPGSVHLAELPKPAVTDIPGGRGVLVRVLRVGVDGTDKEINAAEYGEAPEGSPFLVLGHESFGVVEEVGARVTEVMTGDYVVATVRRPGMSIYDRIGTSDMTTDDVYFERGISRRHGFLTEHYVEDPEFLVKVPQGLGDVGVLLEPTTVVEKGIAQAFEIQRRLRVWRPRKAAVIGAGTIGLLATLALRLRGVEVTTFAKQPRPYLNSDLVETLRARYASAAEGSFLDIAAKYGPFDLIFEASGFAPLVFDAMQALAKNGVLVLSSVTGSDHKVEVPADRINLSFVLGNKVMVGTVNANREYFETGVKDLSQAALEYPGWLNRLLTHPVKGLENYRQLFEYLEHGQGVIKVFCQVAQD